MRKCKISNNVIRRLPRYLRKLDELTEIDIERISSAELGKQLGITPSQVRQDLSTFGEFGLQGYGYHVNTLRNKIADILGGNKGYSAIVIGAGKIGSALISNFSFESCGVTVLCAFDIREDVVGTEICSVPIYEIERLPEFLEKNQVDIAVLAVPKKAVMEISRILQKRGILGIWNFTDAEIDMSDYKTVVENMHFSDSLYALTYYLSERLQT